jgi:release factor glutamine methyltransferase
MSAGRSEDVGGTVSWRQLLSDTTRNLGDVQHAKWVCQRAAGVSGGEWLAVLDEPATQRAVAHLDAMVARRLSGEPLQYVLGSWGFRRLDLMVDRRVLIPRPETEQVVEVALELVAHQSVPHLIADLGTGSGAIALSLAQELRRGSATIWATDASSQAIEVCRANLAGLGIAGQAVRLATGHWYDAIPDVLRGQFDLVVSNPPYIACDSGLVDHQVVAWEPHEALFAGPDGLDDLRTIIAGASTWLGPDGWLVLEIGAGQGAAVSALLGDAGLFDAEIRRDIAGHERIAVARRR